MRIRTARSFDAAAVAALWTEAYSGRGEGEGRLDPYTEREFFTVAEQGEIWVAELDDTLVGVVVLRVPGAPGRAVAGPGEAELARLAVAARARRQGIGHALSELCTARARLAGATAVALWSRPYQEDAHRLYESIGYHRAPERDSSDADGRRLVFALPLGGEARS